MPKHTTALLPLGLLTGCHVFASGDIPLTCDDLPDCGAVAIDTADTGDPADGLVLSVGIGLSLTDGERWLVGAYEPPDLEARIQKSGPGAVSGPVAWASDRNRLLMADGGALYAFGPGEEDIDKFEIPTDEPVKAIQPVGNTTWLITESWLIRQPAGNAALSIVNDDGLSFVSMTADGDLLYVVSNANAVGPDLYTYDTTTDTSVLVAEAFDDSAARVSADLFWGPSGALMGCSTAGAVYSVDEMTAGNAPGVTAFVSATLDDVLACGYDAELERYLVISASQGLFAIAAGEDDTQLTLTADGETLGGAVTW